MPIPYDTLVVGAGSAGAALAARLSADPRRRVLLLEAGPDFAAVDEVPAELTARALSDAAIEHSWDFRAEVVPGRSVDYPVGRVVGGSSAINSGVALRGDPADYDEWEESGLTGWGWQNVLPCFRRLESDRDFAGPHHGSTGPVPIARTLPDDLLHVHRALSDAALDLGFGEAPDLNEPGAIGVGPWPMNVRDGVRVSAAAAYLTDEVRRRPNFDLRPKSLVARVAIDGGKAAGVELADGRQLEAHEVILCAGAISTPGILLRSGVGGAAGVAAVGADHLVDLPGVGENLMDHAFAWLAAVPAPGVCELRSRSVQVGLRFTSSLGERGDMQLLVVIPVDLSASPALARRAGTTTVFMIGAGLQRPRSRGRVLWRGPDPASAPLIELNLTGDRADATRLREGVRLAYRVARSPHMAPYLKRIAIVDEATMATDDELDAYVNSVVASFKHPAGTARMGAREDRSAVVGEDGLVHGVRGLRVADMSIVPTIPRANTNLTAIMLGEKIAELITSGAQPMDTR